MDLTRVDLPLAPHLPRIAEELERRRLLVLQASPGAGKSTLVPPYLLDAPWLRGASVIMLEPRRVAAIAVASRIAELLGERVGERAGFRVRSSSAVGPSTRIEVVTEALLTRKIQTDPLLEGTGLVIFDEFHERSIHADLALALTLELKRARPELALLVMSATLEAERLVSFLGSAAGAEPGLVSEPGRLHAVSTSYRSPPSRGAWEPAFARLAAEQAGGLAADAGGTVLCFLAGMREIRRVSEEIGAGTAIEILHGNLPLEEQRRVLAPRPREERRIVLATSVAETSLTVSGVRVVIDSGWARTSRYHAPTGMDRLETERVSASSAEQRRGRAGRLGPGACIRFWSESERLPPSPEPEILRSDLAPLVLECAVWGARAPEELRWLDLPPRAAWDTACELLRLLRYLDADGWPTEEGRQAVSIGVHPRLAALLGFRRARLSAAGPGGAADATGAARAGAAVACAALLGERDGSGLRGEPDIRLRLGMLRRGEGSAAWREAVGRERRRIARALDLPDQGWDEPDEEEVGDLLVRGFPDRVARRGPDGLWRFPSGRAARLPDGPGLAPLRRDAGAREEREAWLVAVEVDAGEAIGTVTLAAPVARETAVAALEPLRRETTELRWEGLRCRAVKRVAAGRLTLDERAGAAAPPEVASSFFARLDAEGPSLLPWDAYSRRLFERLRFYVRQGGELQIPLETSGLLDERTLVSSARAWLAGWIDGGGGPVLTSERLCSALGSLPRGRAALDRGAPDSVSLPTGRKRRIDYSGAEPAVEARIQELFGLERSPLVGGVPLCFRLLSPASRPLQVTRDLASYWRNTYPGLRTEMRVRYPRHSWPDDPLAAEPTDRALPRREKRRS